MPGGVARTSTVALNNATLPFILALAQKGYRKALADDIHLRNGLNVFEGKITHEAVARDLGKDFVDPTTLFLRSRLLIAKRNFHTRRMRLHWGF